MLPGDRVGQEPGHPAAPRVVPWDVGGHAPCGLPVDHPRHGLREVPGALQRHEAFAPADDAGAAGPAGARGPAGATGPGGARAAHAHAARGPQCVPLRLRHRPDAHRQAGQHQRHVPQRRDGAQRGGRRLWRRRAGALRVLADVGQHLLQPMLPRGLLPRRRGQGVLEGAEHPDCQAADERAHAQSRAEALALPVVRREAPHPLCGVLARRREAAPRCQDPRVLPEAGHQHHGLEHLLLR
mmetsp:Transcript_31461/g.85380  ORF Transcript_31461/g.85380 Transcript_31461/m.85380 type:complete len:240 (-) Transcript_31461:337-1056(-)